MKGFLHFDLELNPLYLIRQWLETLEIHNPRSAWLLCKLIPSHCPFERRLELLGHTLLYIPPLCKLNPLYEQLTSLRFKSLCYLADECGLDITPYC